MPTYEYVCEACSIEWEDLLPSEDRDNAQYCPQCNAVHSYRKMGAPVVLRASHQSGYSRGEGYAEMKRVAKLKVERAGLPIAARDDINKEIAGRTAVANKKKDKKESKA